MKDDGLVLKIAAGIVIGSLTLGGLRFCQQQMAIRQFNQNMAQISADAAAESKRRQIEMARRDANRARSDALKHHAELQAKTLLPGQRCIGKNLFSRVDNGWVQVLDGSATSKCGR